MKQIAKGRHPQEETAEAQLQGSLLCRNSQGLSANYLIFRKKT